MIIVVVVIIMIINFKSQTLLPFLTFFWATAYHWCAVVYLWYFFSTDDLMGFWLADVGEISFVVKEIFWFTLLLINTGWGSENVHCSNLKEISSSERSWED